MKQFSGWLYPFHARPAILEDWPELKKTWHRYRYSVEGEDSSSWDKFKMDLSTLRAYFRTHIMSEGSEATARMTLPVLTYNDEILGFAVQLEVHNWELDASGGGTISLVPRSFILALYKQTTHHGDMLPAGAGKIFNNELDRWARVKGHKAIAGNCRLNFPTRGAARYGYKPAHLVMMKELD